MKNLLLNKAKELFDTPEKWNTFIELSNLKDKIKDDWFKELFNSIKKHFLQNPVNDWSFETSDNLNFWWFLTGYGESSLALDLYLDNKFSLWIDGDVFDIQKVLELVKSNAYTPLLLKFNNYIINEDDHIIKEEHSFVFENQIINDYDEYTLSWFAGKKTDLFAKQIIEKVDSFRKDETIIKLFTEINEKCKIK